MKLVNAKEMRELDALTIEKYAVPGIVLMDGAAKAVADEVQQLLPDGGKAVVFCGKGNNGGDGLGAARWLLNRGMDVRVLLFGAAKEQVAGDAATELKMYEAAGGRCDVIAAEDDWLVAELAAIKADVIVDALLGTGFSGELTGNIRRAVELLNKAQKAVVAVDAPTGVNVDDGSVAGAAVRADVTVTMGLAKPGLYLYPACEYCGEVKIADIGMPSQILHDTTSKKYRLDAEIVKELLPVRAANAHKGTAGKVLVCAGSAGYTGAAALASAAAVKAGAGLVSLVTPLSSRDVLAIKLTEVMVHGLLERMPGVLGGGAANDVVSRAAECDVLAIGPGLGVSESTQEVVREVLAKVEVPVVIDADALTAFVGHTEELTALAAPKVVTPHPGEMARLTGLDAAEIDRRRLEVAQKYAQEWKAVVVLKGAPTVIACPDGTVYLNSTGSSALATGGSGDVLTGIIAGLAAQGITLQEAAICGVYLHGLAGTLACSDVGLAAGEIASSLAQARALVKNS